jgi:hypothetical protein
MRYHAPPAYPTLHASHTFFLLCSYVTDSVFSDVMSRLQSSGDSTIPCSVHLLFKQLVHQYFEFVHHLPIVQNRATVPPYKHPVLLCFILRCPLNRVRILSVHIDQNHITAQAGERFIPSFPHAGVGQKVAFASAMHEPFQRGVPALPCHNVHDTSW